MHFRPVQTASRYFDCKLTVSAFLMLAVPVLNSHASAQSIESYRENTTIATVVGQPIHEGDLPPSTLGQLQELRQREYELKRKAVLDIVRQKLLESEAKKKGVTPEELLQHEVDAKVGDPTPGEVEAYYLGQKEPHSLPFDEVRFSLSQNLRQTKIRAARDAFLQSLQEKSDIAVLLRPPRVEVHYDPARLRGSASAPVVMVEFSDFSCPFCRQAESTIGSLFTKYSGRLSLAYKDFPLRQIHPKAQLAAEASRCAADQRKYWEYHDILFANSDKLSREDLLQHARGLRLDEKRFTSCLDDGEHTRQVEEDFQDGIRAGVSGTPAFFINGIFLAGAEPISTFERIIDEALIGADKTRAN